MQKILFFILLIGFQSIVFCSQKHDAKINAEPEINDEGIKEGERPHGIFLRRISVIPMESQDRPRENPFANPFFFLNRLMSEHKEHHGKGEGKKIHENIKMEDNDEPTTKISIFRIPFGDNSSQQESPQAELNENPFIRMMEPILGENPFENMDEEPKIEKIIVNGKELKSAEEKGKGKSQKNVKKSESTVSKPIVPIPATPINQANLTTQGNTPTQGLSRNINFSGKTVNKTFYGKIYSLLNENLIYIMCIMTSSLLILSVYFYYQSQTNQKKYNEALMKALQTK